MCCGGFIGEVFNPVVDPVVNTIEKTIGNVLANPLPVVETIALTSVTGDPTVAAAAVSALNGGDPKQIATAAVAAYAGQEASSAANAEATSSGASASTAKIASSAVGASTATVTSALASGQPLDKALEAGLTSGALAGGTTGVIEAGKAVSASPYTGQGVKVVPGQGTQLFGDQTSVNSLGFTDKVPTGGGQGLVVDPNTILPSSLAKYGTNTGQVRGTEEGGLQPAYKSASDYLTLPSFDPSLAPPTPYKDPTTVTETQEPVISKTTEALARPIISGALSDLFGLGPKVPGAPSAGDSASAPISQGVTSGTTTSLTGERGAGEIEGEGGTNRKNVWNEESLRLKDALGL